MHLAIARRCYIQWQNEEQARRFFRATYRLIRDTPSAEEGWRRRRATDRPTERGGSVHCIGLVASFIISYGHRRCQRRSPYPPFVSLIPSANNLSAALHIRHALFSPELQPRCPAAAAVAVVLRLGLMLLTSAHLDSNEQTSLDAVRIRNLLLHVFLYCNSFLFNSLIVSAD